ncbi:F-box and leucine-rich repeat protein 2/20 [Microdochium nivale]|nr:F-box and leucine-rich repeat protein 2/20 [Microdochium nivale]
MPFFYQPMAAVASLQTLPSELLCLILDNLVLAPLPTGSRRHLPIPYYTNRGALVNLCLTARRLNAFATCLLYENIVLSSGPQCAALFHSLLYSPRLRRIPKSFASLAPLNSPDDDEDAYQFFERLTFSRNSRFFQGGLHLDDQAKEVVRRLNMSFGGTSGHVYTRSRDFTQHAVAAVMLLMPGIRDMLLELSQHTDYTFFMNDDCIIFRKALGSPAPSWGTPLSALHTLRLQSDPDIAGFKADAGMLSILIPELFHAPNLRQLDFYGDEGNYTHHWERAADAMVAYPDSFWVFLGQLRDLKLDKSQAAPSTVVQLLANCHNVEHLTWTFRQEAWSGMRDLPDVSLDTALRPVAKNLKSLHLESYSVGFGCDEDAAEMWDLLEVYQIDMYDTISSLHSFACLESLKIDMMTLFGPCHRQRLRECAAELSALLPPQLRQLELIERSYNDTYEYYKTVVGHDQWLGSLIGKFAQTCKTEQTLLKDFTLRVFPPGRTSPSLAAGAFRSKGSILDLTSRFSEAGVRLDWRWEQVERLQLDSRMEMDWRA